MLHDRSTGVFLEGRDAQVTVAGFDEFRLHALDLDHFACQRDLDRLRLALADDAQLDLGLRLAAHLLDGIGQRQPLHQRVVELEDQVAGLDAATEGRRVLDRRDDLDDAVFHADLDAETTELALRADLQVLEGIDVEIGRVRIEVGDHPADGVGDQFLVFDGFDVTLLDGVEDLGERTQLLDRKVRSGFLFRECRELQADENAGDEAGADQTCLFQLACHACSCPNYLREAHFRGSTGCP